MRVEALFVRRAERGISGAQGGGRKLCPVGKLERPKVGVQEPWVRLRVSNKSFRFRQEGRQNLAQV